MKRKTILVITITLLLAMLVFGACASGTPSQSAASRQQGGTATVRQIDAMSMDEIVSLLGLRGPPARGNTGNSLQDDIAWMNSWRSVRGSAINFLMNNPPHVARIIYSPVIRQGAVNFERQTVIVYFDYEIRALYYPRRNQRLINGLNRELLATGRNGDWQMSTLSLQNIWSSPTAPQLELSVSGIRGVNVPLGGDHRRPTVDASGNRISSSNRRTNNDSGVHVFSFGADRIRIQTGRFTASSIVPINQLNNVRVRVTASTDHRSEWNYGATSYGWTGWMRRLPVLIERRE